MKMSAAIFPILFLVAYHAISFLLSPQSLPPFPHESCVFITGTSSGIGRETALELAYRGFLVFAGVRRGEDGENIVSEYERANPGVKGIVPVLFDVTDEFNVMIEKK